MARGESRAGSRESGAAQLLRDVEQEDNYWSESFKSIVPTVQVKFGGLEFLLNRKTQKSRREILKLAAWDIKMLAYEYEKPEAGALDQNFNDRHIFSFLGARVEYWPNMMADKWRWGGIDPKMYAVIMTISFFVFMNLFLGAYVPNEVLDVVPIWATVSWSSLSLTAALLSYRGYVACVELNTAMVHAIRLLGMARDAGRVGGQHLNDKDVEWKNFLRNLGSYRIWFYVAIAPAVILHNDPLIYAFTVTVLISLCDVWFKRDEQDKIERKDSIFSFIWDIGITAVVLGYVRSTDKLQKYDTQFSLVRADLRVFTPGKYGLGKGWVSEMVGMACSAYNDHLKLRGMGNDFPEERPLIGRAHMGLAG